MNVIRKKQMKIDTQKEIEELLTRGVGAFVDPDGSFRKKLSADPEGIVIKLGVDPTRPDIHLGHAVILRKLRKFQDLGCKVIFLIGDYTAQIGDPTGKSKVRPEVDQKEIEANMQTYLEQVGKILKTDPLVFSWIRNSDWFTAITDIGFPVGTKIKINETLEVDANSFIGKARAFEESRMQIKDIGMKENIAVVTLRGFLWTLRHITHSRLIERDMFTERISSGSELYLHEMMYPVLQGIDSFALAQVYGSCDLEVGGTDQTFNMLLGRDIMKMNNQAPQAVLSFKLLEGTDGKEKMSKSLDNYIAITDVPSDMYGKVMSIPDSSIINYFELCTFTPEDLVQEIGAQLSKGEKNPRDIKMRLAREITSIYHGEKEAQKAEENFVSTFQKGKVPDEIKNVFVKEGTMLSQVLLEQELTESKTDFRRLITEGAIKKITDSSEEKIMDATFLVGEDMCIKVGKHRFLKISVE